MNRERDTACNRHCQNCFERKTRGARGGRQIHPQRSLILRRRFSLFHSWLKPLLKPYFAGKLQHAMPHHTSFGVCASSTRRRVSWSGGTCPPATFSTWRDSSH